MCSGPMNLNQKPLYAPEIYLDTRARRQGVGKKFFDVTDLHLLWGRGRYNLPTMKREPERRNIIFSQVLMKSDWLAASHYTVSVFF